jgi:hypothetical protein
LIQILADDEIEDDETFATVYSNACPYAGEI